MDIFTVIMILILMGQVLTKSLCDTVHLFQQECGRKMYEAFHRGGIPENNKLLSQYDIMKIKRLLYASQRSSLPPITIHNIVDDLGDPVLNNLRRCQLFNSRNDRVKVIFHPEFLSFTSPLLGLDYEDFVRGYP